MLKRETAARLAKVLALLGSDNAGERAAAAYRAHKLAEAAGIDWAKLLGAPTSGATTAAAMAAAREAAAADLKGFAAGLGFPHHIRLAEELLTLYGAVLLPAQERFLKRIRRIDNGHLGPEDRRELDALVRLCRRMDKKVAAAKEAWIRRQAEGNARRQREHRARRPRKAPVEAACAECDGSMVAKRSTKRFCSETCRARAHLRAKTAAA